MKAKHVLWIFTGLVAVVTMAVGIAVLVDRFITRKECPDGYLTFDSDEFEALEDEEQYGMILRAKGMVAGEDGNWIYFDYVPGESNVRAGKADVTGKFCVIGAKLNEENLVALFTK